MNSLDGTSAFHVQMWDDTPDKVIKSLIPWAHPEQTPLRIAIAGAHGTGKTTLARSLNRDVRIPIIERISRTVMELGYDINKKSDIRAQLAMWLAQYHEQLDITEFVTDRCLLTHLAYATWLQRYTDMGIDAHLVNALGNITASVYNEQYTVAFYLPICWPLRNNGVRSRDKKYQEQIDEIVREYLHAFYVDYLPLPGSSKQKRDDAIGYLKDYGLIRSR